MALHELKFKCWQALYELKCRCWQALHELEFRCCKACHNQTLRAVGRACARRHTLEGHLRGVFSGGEIQRLRRLRQEGHTPTVLVAVSDSFTAALPQSAQGVSPSTSPGHSPQSRPDSHIPRLTQLLALQYLSRLHNKYISRRQIFKFQQPSRHREILHKEFLLCQAVLKGNKPPFRPDCLLRS